MHNFAFSASVLAAAAFISSLLEESSNNVATPMLGIVLCSMAAYDVAKSRSAPLVIQIMFIECVMFPGAMILTDITNVYCLVTACLAYFLFIVSSLYNVEDNAESAPSVSPED